MSQWKNDDSAANSVSWAPALVNKPANTANKTAMFGNTTPSAFVQDQVVGVFGVSPGEASSSNGTVNIVQFKHNGSGYSANAAVTVTGGTGNTTAAAANAQANTQGRIGAINFTNNGVGYTSRPNLAVAPPTAITFNANSAVVNGTDAITIASANTKLLPGDKVQYLVAAGNTALAALANGSFYYISFSNSTVVVLAATPGGANIDLTATAVSETGHSLTGETAVVEAVLSTGKAVAHAGWNLRRVGTGGRAGRVTYECLVAMGSIITDASDDAVLKDS